MKWLFIHLFVFSTTLLIGQKDFNYTAQFTDTPIVDVFEFVESQHDIYFSFSMEDVQGLRLSIDIKTDDLSDYLEAIFKNTNLRFEFLKDTYVLVTKGNNLTTHPTEETRNICGIIHDKVSGVPLAYSNILVVGTDNGTSSNEDGEFNLEIKEEIELTIQISYIGYITKEIAVSSFSKKNCKKINLEFSENEDLYILIKDYITDGVQLTQNGLSTKLSPKKIGVLPGQIEPDVMGAIQFLPGVNSASSKAADIYIRGCTPDQNLLIWEGIPIYHSAHYFGMISAFNPYIIEQMDVYRGGFSAEYGGRIAAVVDLKSSDERSGENYYGVGSNMTHAYAYGKHYFNGKKPTALTLSLRRSFSEFIRTPTFDNITKFNQQGLLLGSTEIAALPSNIKITDDFDFIDSHIKFSSQLNSRDRIEAAGLFAENSFSDQITDRNIRQTQDDNMELSNLGLSLTWQHQFSEEITSELKILGAIYDYNYDYKLEEEGSSRSRISGVKSNMIKDNQIQLSTSIASDSGREIQGGYHLINYDINYKVDELSRRGKDIRDRGSSSSLLHSLYLSAKKPISKDIGYNVGLRASYYETNNKMYLEPRVNLGYQLSNALSLHANYGRHHQFVSQITEFRGNNNGINTPLWALANNMSAPVQVADMFQLGTILKHRKWLLDVQFFKRKINGLSSRAYEFEGVEEGNPINGSANIMGIDLLVKRRFKNFRSWLSYSLSKTELTFDKVFPSTFPADYDQRHTLQWSNQLTLSDVKLAVGLKATTGLPYSLLNNFDITSSPNEPLEYNSFYNGINDYTLPNQYEINLTASYDFKPPNAKWVGYITCSLTNVLNQENIFNRTYYVDGSKNRQAEIKQSNKTNLPLTPNVSFRIEW